MKVTVNTSSFRFSHAKEPRGFGCWCFEVGSEEFFSEPMNFGEACKKAKAFAKSKSVTEVTVLP